MMLSASPFHRQNPFTSSRPSPLAERSANVLPRAFNFTMASQPQFEKKPVPQRAHKPNPIVQSRDAATQRRRDMFFRRVQKDRDDKKWEARGEQIQRLDFVSDHKRWEAAKARQAPELEDDLIDIDDELPTNSTTPNMQSSAPQPEQELLEVDYVLSQEEREMQELIALMEEDQQQQDAASQHYGSDDEDYDQIFMDFTNESDLQQGSNATYSQFGDPDDMDMTDG